MATEPAPHRVRNHLAALRGYLELAREAANGELGDPQDVARDLGDALACLTKLEHELGVHADDGSPGHGDPGHVDPKHVDTGHVDTGRADP